MKDINKRINLCNKIYPYLSGFSSDLLFWAAINTIFLITVKQLSASQVSLLTAISSFAAILAQNIILKIIKKIGNVKSVRLGLILLFIAAIIITSGKSFTIIAIGEVSCSRKTYLISDSPFANEILPFTVELAFFSSAW